MTKGVLGLTRGLEKNTYWVYRVNFCGSQSYLPPNIRGPKGCTKRRPFPGWFMKGVS